MSDASAPGKNYKGMAMRGVIGLVIALALTSFTYQAAVLIKAPLCADMGWDENSFSLFFSTYCAGAIFSSAVLGKLIMKFGVKKITLLGSLAPVIGYTIIAFSSSIVGVWIAGFILSFLLTMASFVPFSTYVSSWFSSGQGKILSLAGVFPSIMNIFMVPVYTTILDRVDVHAAIFGLGVILTVVSFLCILFLVGGLPDDYGCGQVALGGKKGAKASDKPAVQTHLDYDPVMPTRKLALVPPVLTAILAPAVLAIGTIIFTTNPMEIFLTFGVERFQASLLISTMSAVGLVVSVVFGIVNDKVGTRKAITIFMGGHILALALSLVIPGFPGAAILGLFYYLIMFSNSYFGLVIPQTVGLKRSPEFMGFVNMFQGIAGVAAPLIGIAVVSAFGSYRSILVVNILTDLFFLLMVLYSLSSKTETTIREKDKPYLEAAEKEAAAEQAVAEEQPQA
jgi:MFS family permease